MFTCGSHGEAELSLSDVFPGMHCLLCQASKQLPRDEASHPAACSFHKHHVSFRQGLEIVLVTLSARFPRFQNS